MYRAKEIYIDISEKAENIIAHECYAASKLWNVCNYEKRNYKELGFEKYPNWYDQKKRLKDNIWYKSLPSQSAQEVCKQLDKAWASFFALKKTNGIKNPKPPRFKQGNIAVTYIQNGIMHKKSSDTVRLSIPKSLKEHMKKKYNINESYLFMKNSVFCDIDNIKEIRIYPPEEHRCRIIIVYEAEDIPFVPKQGHFLSIDLGVHNLFTCFDSNGSSFIIGRKYLSICQWYQKEIARVQSVWAYQQVQRGIRYPKPSKHILKLYNDRANAVKNYLHQVTAYIAGYCHKNGIDTVVIGDITGIRKGKDFGHKTNQKFHSLPYAKIYQMLEYKLAKYGIEMVRQKEYYTSQCSPFLPKVSKKYAKKSNRVKRGFYKDGAHVFNADCVGAYNILRLYLQEIKSDRKVEPRGLSHPEVIKVAA